MHRPVQKVRKETGLWPGRTGIAGMAFLRLAGMVLLLCTCISLPFSCRKTSSDPDHIHSSDPVDSQLISYREKFFTDVRTGPHHQLDSIYHTYKKLTPWQRAEYYYIKSYISRHLNFDPNRVLAYADSMMMVVDEHPNDPDLINFYTDALFAKAEMNKVLGNYRLAYNYFMDAKKSGLKHQDPNKAGCINSAYDYHIGMILYRQEKYADAAHSFISSYANMEYCDSSMLSIFRREELLNNAGLCLAKMKQYDSSLYYFDKAIQYMKKLKNNWPNNYQFFDVAMGVLSGNKAQVYYAEGDTAKAIEGLMHNIHINFRYDYDMHDGLTSIVHLTDIYLDQKRISEAGRWIDTAQGFLDTIPDENMQKNVFRQKWVYFRFTKKYDSAEYYAMRYTAMNDSQLVRDRLLQNADVQATMSELENEYQLNLLKKDIQLQENFSILMTIVGILAVLIVVVMVYSWRISRKKNEILQVHNAEISVKNEELKKLNENKDRIMAIVAHDLRNPITAIFSLTQMLESDVPQDAHDQRQIIKLIETSCNTSLNLISEIMLMASMSKMDEDLQKERVWLNEFLTTAIGLLQFNADEKQQRINLQLPQDVELLLAEEKMRRVIGNLVVNAIKFSKQGSEINVKAERRGDTVLISVQDRGIGIPANMQDKVFDMFTTAKRTGTAGEKPFGLGLSISKQIIEAHKGRIWFESTEGQGTTFYVELPVA